MSIWNTWGAKKATFSLPFGQTRGKKKLVSAILGVHRHTSYAFLIWRVPCKSYLVLPRLKALFFGDHLVRSHFCSFLLLYCKPTRSLETAGNLIIGVSPRLQTWFVMQPRCLEGAIMIRIVSSDFISAAEEDGCHSAKQFCQFIEMTSCKSSIWLSWTLTHPRWFSHPAHLSSRLLLDFRILSLSSVDRHSYIKTRNFPSFLATNGFKWC